MCLYLEDIWKYLENKKGISKANWDTCHSGDLKGTLGSLKVFRADMQKVKTLLQADFKFKISAYWENKSSSSANMIVLHV